MSNLDLKSAYLVVVVLYFFIPIATWLVLFHSRNRATKLWCAAGLMVAFSTVLFGVTVENLWDRLPFLVAGNTMMVIAVLARVWALRDLANESFDWRWAMWLLSLQFVLIGLSPLYLEAINLRLMITCMHLSLYAYLTYEAWRIGSALKNRSTYWISAIYGVVSLLLVWNLLRSVLTGTEIDHFAEGWFNWVMVLVAAFSTLGVHIGYVGIVIEIRHRSELSARDEALRADIRTEHSQQMAHLQRQNLMGELSSFMSHEVRQPLTAILSSAQLARHLISQGNSTPADMTRIMNAIVQGVNRVDRLMQRVAQHVRAPERHVKEFSIATLVRDGVEMIHGLAHKQWVEVSVTSALPDVMVKGDFIELSQVLLNLIRNAIDACSNVRQDGQVQLSVERSSHQVTILVQDNGPGFDDTALQQAGQPFFTTKLDGLGLGLSISKDLAAQNGAELTWGNASGGAFSRLVVPVHGDPSRGASGFLHERGRVR